MLLGAPVAEPLVERVIDDEPVSEHPMIVVEAQARKKLQRSSFATAEHLAEYTVNATVRRGALASAGGRPFDRRPSNNDSGAATVLQTDRRPVALIDETCRSSPQRGGCMTKTFRAALAGAALLTACQQNNDSPHAM